MKKLLLILLLLQLTINTILAQNTEADKTLLKQTNQELVANYKAGKFDNALSLAQKALDLSVKIYGAESLETATAYKNLGLIYREKKKYRDAVGNLQKAVEIYRLKPEQNAKYIAQALDELALAFALDGDEKRAEIIYIEALATAEKAYGKESKAILPFLKSMTEVFILVKKYDQAQEMFVRQYLTARKYFPQDSRELLDIRQSFMCFSLQAFKIEESLERQKKFAEATQLEENRAANQAINKVINGGVVNGKAKYLAVPLYPANARSRRAQGIIPVQVTINEEGNVIEAKAICGDRDLRAASEEAARQSKFNPTLLGGEPVKVTGTIIYSFVF